MEFFEDTQDKEAKKYHATNVIFEKNLASIQDPASKIIGYLAADQYLRIKKMREEDEKE